MLDKDTYIHGVERELSELTVKIDQLKQDTSMLSAEARDKVDDALRRVSQLQTAMVEHVDRIRKASTDAWGDLKDGVTRARTDLVEAVERAAGEFRGLGQIPAAAVSGDTAKASKPGKSDKKEGTANP